MLGSSFINQLWYSMHMGFIMCICFVKKNKIQLGGWFSLRRNRHFELKMNVPLEKKITRI